MRVLSVDKPRHLLRHLNETLHMPGFYLMKGTFQVVILLYNWRSGKGSWKALGKKKQCNGKQRAGTDTQAWVHRGHSTRHVGEVWLLLCFFVDLGLVLCFFCCCCCCYGFFGFRCFPLPSRAICFAESMTKKKGEQKGRNISSAMPLG